MRFHLYCQLLTCYTLDYLHPQCMSGKHMEGCGEETFRIDVRQCSHGARVANSEKVEIVGMRPVFGHVRVVVGTVGSPEACLFQLFHVFQSKLLLVENGGQHCMIVKVGVADFSGEARAN